MRMPPASYKEERHMFRTLVKTESVAIEDQSYPVRYFEQRTGAASAATARRFCSARRPHHSRRRFGDESRNARATRLVPATLYSRMLARTA